MTVSFKQFNSFVEATPDQIDEIFGRLGGRPEDKEGKMNALNSAKQKLIDKKAAEAERKKDLEEKRNKAWLDAKERAEGRGKPEPKYGKNDEYTMHRQMQAKARMSEDKQAFDDQNEWTTASKQAGLVVKKVSGNIGDGDQCWHAFKDDQKVGEFSEQNEGWLLVD